MKLSDFDFDLPEERIAIRQMSPRGDAKLLVSQAGQIEDAFVRDICSYIRPGDRLVLNDTKVIPARLSCLLYTSPSPRDRTRSRMPSSA